MPRTQGHSLGGAYCVITYGEFLRRQAEPAFANFNFGDMYAFAAPRVCLQPFADEFNRCVQASGGEKCSFRIVNMQDPVATLPPATASEVARYPYVHPGSAWRITTEGPEKMSDEPPPVDPQTYDDIQTNGHYHGELAVVGSMGGVPCVADRQAVADPREYYSSWQITPHS